MDLEAIVQRFSPDLAPIENVYKAIHQYPELSCRENRTASTIASQLREMGLHVHEKIGGHGVVGVFENGLGKIVMLRAELDALPIKEQTELPYASKEHMDDMWGHRQPVMHACGHDMHMACLLAAAKLLVDAKSEWSGTLIVLFQPNEEHTGGAQAMVDDRLYDKIPMPDVVMAQHLMQIPSGSVSIKPGHVLVSADTMRIRVFSSEGHPMNPQVAVDVGVLTSNIVVRIQDLVDEVSKTGYTSIEVQEMHFGGPGLDWVEHADMVLDVKAYEPKLREQLLEGIRDIVDTQAVSIGSSRKPEISSSIRAPVTRNDNLVSQRVREAFVDFFGSQKVLEDVPSHPCEDFSILATAIDAPYLFWFLGRADSKDLERAREKGKLLDLIPIEHSPFNAPLVQPTLETGMHALSIAALCIFKGENGTTVWNY